MNPNNPPPKQKEMCSPVFLSTTLLSPRLLALVEQRVAMVKKEMVRLYPDSTAQEWVEQHVSPVVAPLQRVLEDTRASLLEMVPQNVSASMVGQ